MKIIKIFVLFIIFVFIGCSASDVTEEQTENQTVSYESSEIPKSDASATKTITQESKTNQQTNPEFIPSGPETPPPPPRNIEYAKEEPKTVQPKVEEVKKETPVVVETPIVENYQYKVQVFASKSKLNAETQLRTLKQRMPNQIIGVELDNDLYKVRMGAYSKWEHAKSMKDAVYNLGYTDSFIITEQKK